MRVSQRTEVHFGRSKLTDWWEGEDAHRVHKKVKFGSEQRTSWAALTQEDAMCHSYDMTKKGKEEKKKSNILTCISCHREDQMLEECNAPTHGPSSSYLEGQCNPRTNTLRMCSWGQPMISQWEEGEGKTQKIREKEVEKVNLLVSSWFSWFS